MKTRALAGLLSCLWSALVAQQQQRQHGVWIGMGFGYGQAILSCDSCDRRRTIGANRSQLGGWTLSAGLGWRANAHVQIGADLRTWLNGLKAGDSLPEFTTAALQLSYYPRIRAARGVFIEGATGLSWYDLTLGTGDVLETSKGPTYASGHGGVSAIGIGWEGADWFVTRLTFSHGWQDMVHAANGDVVAKMWKQNVILFEFGGRGVLPKPYRR
jgi:hypothetical protein